MKKLIKYYKGSTKGLPQLTNYGSLYSLFKKVLFEGFNESNVLKITKNDNILNIKLDIVNDVTLKYPINDVLKCTFYDYELLVINHIGNDTIICECINDGGDINIPNNYNNIKIMNAPLGFKLKFFDDAEFKMVYTSEQSGGLDYCLYDTYFGDTGSENGGAATKRAVIFCSTGMTNVNDNENDTHFPADANGGSNYKNKYLGAGSSYYRNGISNIVYGAGVDYTFIGNGNFFYFIVKNKLNVTTDKSNMVDKDIVHGFGKVKSIYENNKNTNIFISAPSGTIQINYGDCALGEQHRTPGGYASFNSYIQPRKSELKSPALINDVSAVFFENSFNYYSTIGEFSVNYESGCSYYGGGLNLEILYENLNSYSITRSLICTTDASMKSYRKIAYMPFMYYFTTRYVNTPNDMIFNQDNRKFYKVETFGYSLNGNGYDSRFLIEITPKGYNNYD